jgi:LysM repeat protein
MYNYFWRQCPPNTFAYTIKPGDTFYKLARQFNTTIPAIISANPLVNPLFLQIGQTICIPRQQVFPPCPEGNYYIIKAGDTLYSIARRYNVSLDDLIEANPGIDPDRLAIGQVICIPLAVPPVECPAGTEPYTIKRGDTFYKIARRFNVTLDSLLKANPGVNPDALLIGQKICIPSEEEV